jgi:hypothetical protein
MYVDLQQFAAILLPRESAIFRPDGNYPEATPWKIAENRTLKWGSSPPPSRGGNLAGHKRPHLQSISLPLERGHESFITKTANVESRGGAKRAGSQARAPRSTFPGLEDCALQYIRAEPCLRLTNMNDHNLHSHLGSLPLIVRPPTVSLT